MAQKKKQNTTAKNATPAKSKSSAKNPPKKTGSNTMLRRSIWAVICLFLSLFSFIGYSNVDAWFITYFCGFVKGLIGWGYYIFPPMVLVCACTLIFSRGKKVARRIISALLAPIFLGGLVHLFINTTDVEFTSAALASLYSSGKLMESGGLLSGLIAFGLNEAVSIYGAAPVFFLGFVFFALNGVGLTIPVLISMSKKRQAAKKAETAPRTKKAPQEKAHQSRAQITEKSSSKHTLSQEKKPRAIDIPIDEVNVPDENYKAEKVGFFNIRPRVRTPDQVLSEGEKLSVESPVIPEAAEYISPEESPAGAGLSAEISSESVKPSALPGKISHEEVVRETEEITRTIEKELSETENNYAYPPIDLLNSGTARAVDGREEIALNRDRLESTIRSFGVSASITGVTRGPTVTRYDLELDQGVKLSKLTNLAGDLALSLGVSGVRIAPIPDKISTVGVEVPNKLVSTVYLRDIIDSPAFANAPSKLSFAIGKDIGGNAIVGNISKLPHLLIAGTTGSGKSVCMNSLILSLLYKATPEEVRLIMIDPKMVELGIYNGIPHLFVPVVTDPKKAAGALQWAVVEMLKRYRLFSEVGVRDLAGYNNHQNALGEPTLPQVIIVIDELADLMLVASKEVEESICRVAQMGRASGMHLIIATQRPSADVITGLMKANIPSRIAFAVSSALESRIILDNSGAEKLIGAGDMLYAPLGAGKPLRIQGAFVSDEEREKVISFVKSQSEAEYSEDILAQIEIAALDKNSSGSDNSTEEVGSLSGYDDLLPQAVDVIFETKQASVSMLQRRLKLGYARAARIVDQMEELGIVGPFEGSKPRQLLMTRQQWQEMNSSSSSSASSLGNNDSVSFSDFTNASEETWKD